MPATKRKSKPTPVRKPTARRHTPRKPITSMVVAAPQPKPWLLSQDEVTILKNAVCKGASDDQLKFCLAVAKRYELDPFRQEIWFVPRWDSSAERTDGKKGDIVYGPVVGIGGMLHIAARDHADFGSYSEPEYGPMLTINWADQYGKKGTFQAPEWCRIEAWKKGSAQPTVAKVWWEEIYPDVSRAPLVRRMPRLMLAKCAKAQATRTAYPKTGGLAIQEETYSREFTDITPQVRIIVDKQVEAEKRYEEREDEAMQKLTPAQREVVETKMAEVAAKGPQIIYAKPEGEKFRLTGPREMLIAHKKGPLYRYWSSVDKAFILDAEQLNELSFVLEKLGISIKKDPNA